MKTQSVLMRGHTLLELTLLELTLLELTIALALGVLIVAAALSMYRAQRVAFDRATDAARVHDAGAVALDFLGQQVQMAGFATGVDSAGAVLFGCSQGRVTGTDMSASCESLSSRSDGMQVRYSADTVSTWPTSGGAPTDCLGQAVADGFVTNRFYAKPSTSSGEPELYCEGSRKQAQPFVDGIEKIRVTYWLAGLSSAVDASAISRERWPYVYAADICVLVRGYLNQAKRKAGYIDCAGANVVAEDGRTHQAFWRHVAIRNALAADARGDA